MLGHSVSNLGIGTTQENVKAVLEFPTPTNIKSLKRFIGLAVFYRKLVEDFAQVAVPLYRLFKKDVAWNWDDKCQAAMDHLKAGLTQAPTLAHPNYNKPFSSTQMPPP